MCVVLSARLEGGGDPTRSACCRATTRASHTALAGVSCLDELAIGRCGSPPRVLNCRCVCGAVAWRAEDEREQWHRRSCSNQKRRQILRRGWPLPVGQERATGGSLCAGRHPHSTSSSRAPVTLTPPPRPPVADRVETQLGEGTFGTVVQCHDEQKVRPPTPNSSCTRVPVALCRSFCRLLCPSAYPLMLLMLLQTHFRTVGLQSRWSATSRSIEMRR